MDTLLEEYAEALAELARAATESDRDYWIIRANSIEYQMARA